MPVPSKIDRSDSPHSGGRFSRVTPAAVAAIVLLGVWLSLVTFTATRHEFWRDEVRALSIARAASSPLDLYRLVQYDGHPALWHLLLLIGTSIVDTPLVLPVTSILVAFAAVALFLHAAPFPIWARAIFMFSALAVFEYSVMARNYGISMLLLFLSAVLYRSRTAHPFRLAFALALLANTNVHAAMFACLIAAVWLWDLAADQWKGRVPRSVARYLPLAVVAAGVLVSMAVAMPRENTILTPVREEGIAGRLEQGLLGAVLRPDLTFSELIPAYLRPKPAILLLYGASAGLALRPNLLLAALVAQTALGVFFRLVYPGWYRHQGLYLLFLVFLYWVLLESPGIRNVTGIRRLMLGGGLLAVLALVVFDVGRAPRLLRDDITSARSSSRALGEFLRTSDAYRAAVILGEPDFVLESLPYYAANPIYLPREGRFSPTVSWTSDSKARLSLGELLSAARDVRARSGRPVVIVLAPIEFDRVPSGEQKYLYGSVFSWTPGEVEEFRRSTRLIAAFDAAAGDEDYMVYALEQP